MKPETKKEIKDTLNTMLLCGIAIGIVIHLHNLFGGDKSAKSDKDVVTKNIVKTDSVRTDSIPSLSFVQEQMHQQKTR